MKKTIQLFCLAIVGVLILTVNSMAQQVQRPVAISAYIYNFAKNIQWQHEDSIREFHFLIIGQDKDIIREMMTLSKAKTLKNKPIRVSSSATVANFDQVQLIFVTKEYSEDVVKIFDKIEGKNVLLITDSYQDKNLIMINFFDSQMGTLLFEINKANIINQHLSIMQDMILLGGTEVDVAALFRQGQQSLRSLQKYTEDIEKNLSQLEKTIISRNKEVQDSRDSLARQASKIQGQQKILDAQSLLLLQRKNELEDQVQKIQEHQQIFNHLKQNLETQKAEIENGNIILQDQKEYIQSQKQEISAQSTILEKQNLKLHRQRNLVYLLVIIIFMAVILAFTILYAYRSKQKLNKELESRVAMRTKELNNSNQQLLVELSERKQAERRLMESEIKYRTLLENLPQKIFFKNSALTFVSCNENFANELNIKSSEITGKTDYDFFPQEIAEKYRKDDFDFLASGKLLETEESMVHEGQTYWTQIIKIPVKDENDAVAGVQGIFWDITQRKRAEEELKRTNQELISINKLISTSTSVLDTSEMLDKVLTEALDIVGLEGGTICVIEPDDTLKLVASRETSDATVEEFTTSRIRVGDCLCGNCAHDNCPLILNDRDAVLQYSKREVLRNEQIQFHAAFPCVTKEKCVGIVCVFTRTLIKPADRNLKLLETLTSQVALAIENGQLFEEIKAHAHALEDTVAERTAQLVSINKELESFSYSISHDLRAPLRAIFGFSQILARRHRESLNDEGRQYMDYIVEASIRMEQLINDLLNYSRLGRKSLDLRPVSLSVIINNVYADFRQKLEEIGGHFNVDHELPQIKGDESLFRQIFTNLIENAIIYRRPEVTLEISISCEHLIDGCILKISDNGIGIPQEYLEKIFDIFQRLHSEDKYPGTGIGLATVRKAVSMLNGTVSVESEVGKGSTFIINFTEYKTTATNG